MLFVNYLDFTPKNLENVYLVNVFQSIPEKISLVKRFDGEISLVVSRSRMAS